MTHRSAQHNHRASRGSLNGVLNAPECRRVHRQVHKHPQHPLPPPPTPPPPPHTHTGDERLFLLKLNNFRQRRIIKQHSLHQHNSAHNEFVTIRASCQAKLRVSRRHAFFTKICASPAGRVCVYSSLILSTFFSSFFQLQYSCIFHCKAVLDCCVRCSNEVDIQS